MKPLTHLGTLPVSQFLNDYWQRKPLFTPNAFPGWQAPLDSGDLAGLTLEESVESRLVIESPNQNPFASQWQLEHGPLAEKRFESLPSSHFTLLVQALDQICPEVRALLDSFRFLPNWRLDDIMASAATTGGSVGPHFDYYDVFLLQATGTRRWQLGQMCDDHSPLLKDCPLKILTEFESHSAFDTQPGDLLYIPARMAHWGVATSDDCTTYSIGFRAPSLQDILLDISQTIAADLPPHIRYQDSPATLGALSQQTQNPGLLSANIADELAEQIKALITPEKVLNWLGGHLTEATRQTPNVTTDTLTNDSGILAPHVRAAYTIDGAPLNSKDDKRATLYLNGDQWSVSTDLASAICSYTEIHCSDFNAQDQAAIQQWINHGYLSLQDSADADADY